MILIFTMLHFLKKKNTKNTCRYHYQNLDDMIYSSSDIEQNKLKLVILGHFLPFIPLKTPKIKILQNEKICLRHHHFHMCTKNHNHIMYDSWDTEWHRHRQNLGHFLSFYLPLPPNNVRQTKIFNILSQFLSFQPLDNLEDQNFNIEKNTWRYYHFAYLHHKWQSYHV